MRVELQKVFDIVQQSNEYWKLRIVVLGLYGTVEQFALTTVDSLHSQRKLSDALTFESFHYH